MLLLCLAVARADSAETGDTGAFADTDAVVDSTYVQENGGCSGGKAAFLLLLPLASLLVLPRRK